MIYDNSDVSDASSKVPCNDLAWGIGSRVGCRRQLCSTRRKEHHEVRDPPVVDVRIRLTLASMRVSVEIAQHVLMNFFLQINAERAMTADHFIGTNACIGGDIASGIGNANVA
jgi:hypothetical protein